jgi:hypothetical protein
MRWLWFALLCAPVHGAQQAPLSIVNVALHQFEDGPSTPASFAFAQGEAVFVSFQVLGYQSEGDDKTVKLDYHLDALDAAGVLLVEGKTGKVKADLAEQDKEWRPKVRWEFALPPLIGSGSFRIKMAVKDMVSGQEAAKEISFTVRSREVEPSDTLVVRNFRFLRGEEDANPLAEAAYRPGDTVWARFDITGFKLAGKNGLHVEYDISVVAPSGNTMFTQRNAAVQKEESFYPKRYVPGVLSLNLLPTIKPGEYVIVLSLRDEIGKQAAGSRHPFRIE